MVTPNLMVVDLYHLDEVTSFANAAAAGIKGIIHKASTGESGTDPKYASRRKAAIDAGLLWGAYHWGTHGNVATQVQNFLSAVFPNGNPPDQTTLLSLDFETTKDKHGNDISMTLDQAREFLVRIDAKLGRKAVIYGGSMLKEKLGNTKDAFFGSHRLWLAQYGPNPEVQKSWDKFWLWQYTDGIHGPGPKTVNGIPGNSDGDLDCDSYSGNAQQLKTEWAS